MSTSNQIILDQTFPGQQMLTGDQRKFLLKLHVGSLAARDAAFKVSGNYISKNVTGNGSVKFDIFGRVGLKVLAPNTLMVAGRQKRQQAEVALDELVYAKEQIRKIDQIMADVDMQSQFTRAVGQAQARAHDLYAASVILQACAAPAYIPGETEGGIILTAPNGVDLNTDMSALVAFLGQFDAQLEDRGADSVRDFHISPVLMTALVNSGKLTNKDLATDNGDIGSGIVYRAFGLGLKRNSHIPHGDFTDEAVIQAALKGSDPAVLPAHARGNYTGTIGFGGTHDTLIEVTAQAVTPSMDWDPDAHAWNYRSTEFGGKGVYDPQGACQLKNGV